MESKEIFIISTVRSATEEYVNKLEQYVQKLESSGHSVHLPHRDTNQENSGFDICVQNTNAINDADEVHIFYNSKSQGTHFDLGVAFALNKKLVVVENENYCKGKSFAKMIDEWSRKK